jgi:hypothetical protein
VGRHPLTKSGRHPTCSDNPLLHSLLKAFDDLYTVWKQARYRDISFHTMSEKGTQANDTFKTIIQTTKKLRVNSYHYLRQRLSNTLETPMLAEMILAKADAP